MAGTNGDDEMSFNACNAGSRFIRGKGDRFPRGYLLGDDPSKGVENSCL